METRLLLDGSEAPSNGEHWRHECEARAVLAMPLHQRKQYLRGGIDHTGRTIKGVLGHRGQEEVNRLERTMMEIWIRRQAKQLAKVAKHVQEDRLAVIEKENNDYIRRRIEERVALILNETISTEGK